MALKHEMVAHVEAADLPQDVHAALLFYLEEILKVDLSLPGNQSLEMARETRLNDPWAQKAHDFIFREFVGVGKVLVVFSK